MTVPQRPPLATLLTRRLAWIAVAVVLVNAVAVALYYGFDRVALEREATTRELSRLELALTGDPPRITPSARGLFEIHRSHYAFAVLDPVGRIIDAENRDILPVQIREAGGIAEEWTTRLVTPDGPALVTARRVEHGDESLTLVFLMQGDPARLLVRALVVEFAKHIWLPILPIVLILIGANALMIRHGLRPVAIAAAWARDIRPGMPTPAPIEQPLPGDIADLVDATQRSLERLNLALAAEKRRAAEAAHALRTPVAVLVARLDALPEGATTDRLREDLSALSRTVQQVLASAWADTLELCEAPVVDLARIAEGVTAALAPFAHARQVELSLCLEDAPVMARADPDGVELALSNLVENAVLHGGPGTVEIIVGPGALVRVRDRGPGLPPGSGTTLFQPFWRGERAAPGGAGLGLAIVDRLQRAQGGSVEAGGSEGGGAEFQLRFRPG